MPGTSLSLCAIDPVGHRLRGAVTGRSSVSRLATLTCPPPGLAGLDRNLGRNPRSRPSRYTGRDLQDPPHCHRELPRKRARASHTSTACWNFDTYRRRLPSTVTTRSTA